MVGAQRRALVTGASRGIGKAAAIALAERGWDVAITARTLTEGHGVDTSEAGAGRTIPGSLETTAALIEDTGGRALPLVVDLHEHDQIAACVATTIEVLGGVELVVNNAIDAGPGSMTPILDLTIEQLEAKLDANVVAQLVLIKAVLPSMLEHGTGTIIDVTSNVATHDPPGPIGEGGWGLAYAASKAAFHRFAPLLAIELGTRGIRAFNLDPGFVVTERQEVNAAALGLDRHYVGAPPSVPGRAIAWLAEHPDDVENGSTVKAQRLALDLELHPDWRS